MRPNKKSLGAAYGAYGAELFLHRKGHFMFFHHHIFLLSEVKSLVSSSLVAMLLFFPLL
jgi:hypothetical protein